MKTEELFRFWDRFDHSDCTELKIETDNIKFVLSRQAKNAPVVSLPQTAGNAPAVTVSPAAGADQNIPAGDDESGTVVRSPLVGTFYRSPAPGEAPFVTQGQKVSKGDTLAIIEAMKLMNEITAPCDGVVTKIFVDDETLVEFDQKLVCIGEE